MTVLEPGVHEIGSGYSAIMLSAEEGYRIGYDAFVRNLLHYDRPAAMFFSPDTDEPYKIVYKMNDPSVAPRLNEDGTVYFPNGGQHVRYGWRTTGAVHNPADVNTAFEGGISKPISDLDPQDDIIVIGVFMDTNTVMMDDNGGQWVVDGWKVDLVSNTVEFVGNLFGIN